MFIFVLFTMQFGYLLKKVCLGFEPGAARWKDGSRRLIHWTGPNHCDHQIWQNFATLANFYTYFGILVLLGKLSLL